ncbi:hypothetical protein AWZ03_009167 [Drosophila navojoa]|uniref:Uncharacterized protein n=1 Tax=Drosophila navojoa TaxID=7232 RepID=A0A484B6U3_DRONA|nr:hypothetical protein AWZ03_009167 [Drosophila navojoa]
MELELELELELHSSLWMVCGLQSQSQSQLVSALGCCNPASDRPHPPASGSTSNASPDDRSHIEARCSDARFLEKRREFYELEIYVLDTCIWGNGIWYIATI